MHFPFKTEFELIKKYKFKSIFWVYFKYIFIVTFIPVLIISSVITAYYSFSTRVDFNNTAYEKLHVASVSMEIALKEIDNAHFQLSASTYVRDYASGIYQPGKIQTRNYVSEIYDHLLNLIMYGHYIDNIHIYFPNRNFIISNNETNSLDKHSQKPLFDAFINEGSLKYTIYDEKTKTLHYSLPIYIDQELQLVAIYDIKMQDILLSPDGAADICISEEGTNKVIFASDGATDILNNRRLMQAINSPNEVFSSANYATVCIPIYTGQYNFTGRIYKSTPFRLESALFIIVMCMIILTILIPILVAFYFSSRFYSSISELTNAFGGYSASPDSNTNELVFLSNNISTTLEKNKLIENQLAANAQNLKQLQAQALQMQINPHFVFNTLNLANVIIMRELKKSNDAEAVISHLANLMSVALDTKHTIISVSEELKYIDEFIEIEKIRFKNKFDVIYEISPEVYDRDIIKFTLQPVLENAFEYGIKPLKNANGVIKIKALTKGEDTLFTISNNGEEISPERLKELRRTLEEPAAPEKHIGLYNVNKRIRLMCGEKYGVHITSSPDATSITLKFKF